MKVNVEVQAGWWEIHHEIDGSSGPLRAQLRERLMSSDIRRELIVDAGIDTSDVNEDGHAYTGVTVAVPLWEALDVAAIRDVLSNAIKRVLEYRGGGDLVYELRNLVQRGELEFVELSPDGVMATYSLEVAG